MTAAASIGPDLDKVGFETVSVPVPPASAHVLAVGATDQEGVFLAFLDGSGFHLLHLEGASPHWTQVGELPDASPDGALGLFFSRKAVEEKAEHLFCTFVEASRKTLVCSRLVTGGRGAKKKKGDGAVVLARTALPDDIQAAVGTFGARSGGLDVVTVATGNGTLRCYEASSGKGVGKGLKLEVSPGSKGSMCLVSLPTGINRFAFVQGVGCAEADLYVVTLSVETRTLAVLCSVRLHVPLSAPAPLSGAAALGGEGDRLLLCWGTSSAKTKTSCTFTTVARLEEEEPSLAVLPCEAGPDTSVTLSGWLAANGYLAEISAHPSAMGEAKPRLRMIVRDSRFGLKVGDGELTPLAGFDKVLTASSSASTLSLLATGGAVLAIRWRLPAFSLRSVLGSQASFVAAPLADVSSAAALTPLREVLTGKRKADDPDVEALFKDAKRHGATDRAIAAEVQARVLRPCQALLDNLVRRKCWNVARALLALPELSESHAVQLLAAQPTLLARVVRRAQNGRSLAPALREHLPASQLESLLEILIIWLDCYRYFPQDVVRTEMPDLPSALEIVEFLGAVVDGCLPSLPRVNSDLVDRVLYQLGEVQSEVIRTEQLYSQLRAALRPRTPLPAMKSRAPVEVMLLPL